MKHVKITPETLEETCCILGVTEDEFMAQMSAKGFLVEIIRPDAGEPLTIVCGAVPAMEGALQVHCGRCGAACWRSPRAPAGKYICQACYESMNN